MLMNTRKPQSNAVLSKLTGAQKERLARWLLAENRSYTEVRALLKTEYGVETSRAALCRYYQRWLAPRLVGPETDELAGWRGLETHTIEEAVIGRSRQLALSALTLREPDLRTAERTMALATGLERVRIERDRAELEARRVALLAAKAGRSGEEAQAPETAEAAGEQELREMETDRGMQHPEFGSQNLKPDGAENAASGSPKTEEVRWVSAA